MEDELEDRILYQTYLSHMKILSKLAVGFPFSSSHMWRILRLYVLKPEILLFSALLVVLVVYLHSVEVWSRNLLSKLHFSLGASVPSKIQRLQCFTPSDEGNVSWELKTDNVSVYAVQGRRQKMEDRFVVDENIDGCGVSLYAVFDGHGGEFAANYARDNLIKNLKAKVCELKRVIANRKKGGDGGEVGKSKEETTDEPLKKRIVLENKVIEPLERKASAKKTAPLARDDSTKKKGGITDPVLLAKLGALKRPITREVRDEGESGGPLPPKDISSYLDGESQINYNLLVTDEVLAVDRLLVQAAKKRLDVAGTTALIALIEGSTLIVANVGDSRGVMCDIKGNAIPLSFDHKPQQMREMKRIKEAGGFITFNGVWRVAGILATSRALGDYPLKDKRLVIAEPDILTFDLDSHKPAFLVLASDGLWDTFSNEEAIAFLKEHITSPDLGAKSITMQSYCRGSLDNITVLIIRLKYP